MRGLRKVPRCRGLRSRRRSLIPYCQFERSKELESQWKWWMSSQHIWRTEWRIWNYLRRCKFGRCRCGDRGNHCSNCIYHSAKYHVFLLFSIWSKITTFWNHELVAAPRIKRPCLMPDRHRRRHQIRADPGFICCGALDRLRTWYW